MLQLYYGGTFDPIHQGHLAIARAARDELHAPVRLVPAADPPHRARPGAPAALRAGMVALAIADEPGLVLDCRELERAERDPERRSYTIDTLRELRDELGPAVPIAWLIGADSLLGLGSWHAWRELFELGHFVVAERPGSPLEQGLPPELADFLPPRWAATPADLLARPGGRVLRLHQPLQPESASEVRRRIAAGEPWQDLVPAPVAGFIRQQGLYLTPGSSPGPL